MKKTLTTSLLAILMCVCMVFGFTACGGFTQNDIDNAVNEATTDLNTQITALEADIADKETKIATLEGEKTALTTEKTELQADIATLEAAKTTLTAEKADLENDVAALEAEKKTLSDENAELEASITAKNTEIETLTSSVATLETEKTTLNGKVTEINAQITTLNDRIAELEEGSEADGAEITELKAKVSTLEGEKATLTAKVSELEGTIAEKNAAIANLEKEKADLETVEADLKGQITSLNDTITEKNSKIDELNSSISALNTEKTNLTARVTELEASITAKDNEIAGFKSSISTLQDEKAALESQITELENKNEELEAENEALKNCLKGVHDWNEGVCTVCEATHDHAESDWADGACTVCGATAKITGVSITVDGTTYSKGQTAIITPSTQSVIFTVTGTNLQNSTNDNIIQYDSTTGVHVTTEYLWNFSEDGTSATNTFPASLFVANTTAFEISYSNDGASTLNGIIGTGIYVIYSEDTVVDTTAKITGVSITVDGTTYTKGQTAIITPSTQSVIFTVTGTNLQNSTNDNRIYYYSSSYMYVTRDYGWKFSEDGTSATSDFSSFKDEFRLCVTAFEIPYTNDGSNYTGSGVSVIYSIPEEDRAVITGVSITVDGTTYTSGTVTITPSTQSVVFTVTGTKLQNGTGDNRINFRKSTYTYVATAQGWDISEDGTSATRTYSSGRFVDNTTAFEIPYTNDGGKNYIGTGIYVIYVAD